jgi:hypothetical protein
MRLEERSDTQGCRAGDCSPTRQIRHRVSVDGLAQVIIRTSASFRCRSVAAGCDADEAFVDNNAQSRRAIFCQTSTWPPSTIIT